jgi:SOS-response transcriptional repressor LexA
VDDITPRQREIFDFIKGYIEKYRVPPTLQEIAESFGFYVNAAAQHIGVLEKKGWIGIRRRHGTAGRTGRVARAIFLLEHDGDK